MFRKESLSILNPNQKSAMLCYSMLMEKQTFIFIGASGSGKGTQVNLLKDELKKRDPNTPIFYLQTGQLFREFVNGDTYAAKAAREALQNGELLPGFVAMWMWSDVFLKNLRGDEHLFLDGSPRTVEEVHHLDIAMKFFRRPQPTVIYIKVSPEWSMQHMLERATKEGRADDTKESIAKRLSWFAEKVVPAINLYRRDRDYHFIEINGEQSIEDVHRDIVKAVFAG